MTKNFKLLLAITLLLTIVMVGIALAHPMSITCPIDGQMMIFDHRTGGYPDGYCWYSHEVGYGNVHSAYIPCEN